MSRRFAGTPLPLTAIEFAHPESVPGPADVGVQPRADDGERLCSATSRSPTAPSTAISATSAPSSRRLACDNVDRDRARRRLQARPLRERGMTRAGAPRNGGRRSASSIFAVLATVAVLPLVGLFFFRLYENQLIRQTQAELIAQSRVLATIYAQEVDSAARQRPDARRRGAAERAARPRRPGHRRSGPRSTSPPTISCGGGRMRKPRRSRRSQPMSRSAQG